MAQVANPQQFHPEPHIDQIRIASGLNCLVGLYVLVSAWIGGANSGNQLNGIILGAVVSILAATRFFSGMGPWASWINAIVGALFIISPWVYGYAGEAWMWNSIVVGIVMVVLGVWSALAGGRARPTPQP